MCLVHVSVSGFSLKEQTGRGVTTCDVLILIIPGVYLLRSSDGRELANSSRRSKLDLTDRVCVSRPDQPVHSHAALSSLSLSIPLLEVRAPRGLEADRGPTSLFKVLLKQRQTTETGDTTPIRERINALIRRD